MAAWSTFPRDWWRFVRAPGAFLASTELTTTKALKHATKYLLLGVGGVIAFSKVNLKFSPDSADESSRKIFEGNALVYSVALGCLVTIAVAHLVARAFRGS